MAGPDERLAPRVSIISLKLRASAHSASVAFGLEAEVIPTGSAAPLRYSLTRLCTTATAVTPEGLCGCESSAGSEPAVAGVIGEGRAHGSGLGLGLEVGDQLAVPFRFPVHRVLQAL